MKALRAVWQGIVDAYGELFPAVGMNLLWLVLSILPAAFCTGLAVAVGSIGATEEARQALTSWAFLLYAILLFVGPNPAAAGLHAWANQLVKEERLEFGLFWQGLREYGVKSSVLFAISAIGLALLLVNLNFYIGYSEPLFYLGILWVWVILIWMLMQIYLLPLLVEQQVKSLKLVYRNAFFLTMANPLVTLVIVVFCAILLAVSVAVVILITLVAASIAVLIINRALASILERHRPAPTADRS